MPPRRHSSRRIQPRSLVRHSPDGLRVGARAGMRYAADSAASPTPPPIRVRPDTLRGRDSLTRAAQTRRRRRICAGACPSAPSKAIFRSKSVALGPKMAPATQFCPKNGLRRRCKAAGNSSGSRRTTCFRRPACQARTQDRARHRPDRASAFSPGVGPLALRGYDLSISGVIFITPRLNHAPHATPPSHLRARRSPTSGPENRSRHYAAPAAGTAKGAARLHRAPIFCPLRSARS